MAATSSPQPAVDLREPRSWRKTKNQITTVLNLFCGVRPRGTPDEKPCAFEPFDRHGLRGLAFIASNQRLLPPRTALPNEICLDPVAGSDDPW